MSQKFELQGWPTGLDSVQWSEFNELAVALGEVIEILTPKLSFFASTEDDFSKEESWYRVRITASLFSESEWPYLNPLPSSLASVGEEQSYSPVSSLAWSPAGLAKHKKCALSVLSCNHLLSIWQCDGMPQHENSWRRVLVVNHAVTALHQQSSADGDSFADPSSRLAWRIRSFSWGPVVQCTETIDAPNGRNLRVTTARFLLAVTNDLGELAVLEVRSPHQILVDLHRKWSCHVVFRSTVSSAKHIDHKVGHIDGEIFSQGTFASNLSWCKRKTSPGADQQIVASIMAFCTGRKLSVKSFLLNTGQGLTVMATPQNLTISGDHEGPLKLIPNVSESVCFVHHWLTMNEQSETDVVRLISFSKSQLNVTEIRESAAGVLTASTTYNYDAPKRPLAGVTYRYQPSTESYELHQASHLSLGTDGYIQSLKVSPSGLTTCSPASWTTLLKEARLRFSAEHNIGGRVVARVSGLSSSHTGAHFAASFSLHPSELIQYFIETQMQSTLVVSNEHETPSSSSIAPAGLKCESAVTRFMSEPN